VTLNQDATALTQLDKQIITIVPHTTNGADPTLAVNGLTAKQIRTATGVNVASGTMVAGTPYQLVYFSSAGEFILMGFTANPFNIPIGGCMFYLGTTAPNSSFALPYGQAISRTTYATLFALAGTAFGTGDGTTTFNLPDIRGRVVAGKDDMGGSASGRINAVATDSGTITGATMGSTGGSATHILTTAELPSITPAGSVSITDPNHFHYEFNTNGTGSIPVTDSQFCTVSGNPGGDGSYSINGTGTTPTIGKSSSASTGISASFSGTPFGSGNSHAILPPTIILPYIVRLI
jgi:microcystin-dependent protein